MTSPRTVQAIGIGTGVDGVSQDRQDSIGRGGLPLQLPDPPPTLAADPVWPAPRSGAALLTAEDLEAVRDDLLARLSSLDAQRAEVMRRLEQLRTEGVAEPAPPPQRVTPSLAGARIRWVGA